ncbi:MAG: hypothetical protein NC121_06830 [Blautia sp.]|nr:hypothetical protein [Blautia sp.]
MAKWIGTVRQKTAHLSENGFWKKLSVWSCILAAVCILIPLFYYSGYNFICLDDYSIGAQTHLAWEQREGFFSGIGGVLSSVAQRVGAIYMGWGGNYSSMIFTSLQPAVFHEELAVLNTYILLGIFVAANLYFFRKLFCRKFRFSWETTAVMAAGVLILSTQWLPSAVEGFYWFNGSFYNIAGYAMGLVFVVNMYEIAWGGHKGRMFYVVTALVGIFVAGTNYTTMLFLMLLGGASLLGLLCVDGRTEQKRGYLILYLIFLAFCFVNILAPGNSVRQGDFERMGIVASIFNALVYGREMYLQETNARLLIFYVVLLPFLLEDLKKIRFRFPCPVVFSAVVYLLFSAMFAPTLCALHSTGPDRTQNVYYWAVILLHLCNYVYWLGWLQKSLEKAGHKLKALEHGKLYLNHFCLCAILLFVFLTQMDISAMTSFTVMRSVASGEARQWKEEMEARREILQDPQIPDVVLEPVSVCPELLYMGEVDEDADFWVNLAIAQWYQKNSVVLRSSE